MGFTVKDLLRVSEQILEDSGDSDYKTDASILLCEVLGYDEKKLFMNWTRELEDYKSEIYLDLVRRRAEGEPTQYIAGKAWFMGLEITVTPGVLIPRPETEILVAEALKWLSSNPKSKRVLDLCTGSGVIALAIARKMPGLKLSASDISGEALEVAERNAARLNARNISFKKSDLFEQIKTGAFSSKFDLIVSNPPYIKADELPDLQREIYEHEPMLALDGGPGGLDVISRIVTGAPGFLRSGGRLMLEIGADQAGDVTELMAAQGDFGEPEVIKDIAGHDRVVSAGIK